VNGNGDPLCGLPQASDAQGLVHCEFIPEGRTVNKKMCVEMFRYLRVVKETPPKMGTKQLSIVCATTNMNIVRWWLDVTMRITMPYFHG
jgi:hypothetical protein